MSKIRIQYEILVSGIYPFEGNMVKEGFELVKKSVDVDMLDMLYEAGAIYISPYIGYCCYPDKKGSTIYITLQKEMIIDIDYKDEKEYDVKFTNQCLENMNLFLEVDNLQKIMILEINNNIRFPIKLIKVYDLNDNYITTIGDVEKINIPSLLCFDKADVNERIKRQGNRLNSGISYKSIQNLSEQNEFFNRALSFYYSSFSVNDEKVGFTLLITALEALLSLATYSKIETCSECKQKKFAISSTISENVSMMLMDNNGSIKKKMKDIYSIRSKYIHGGKRDITIEDERELQEYVRKVLLMYWCISLNKKTYNHQEIILEVKSKEYNNNVIYRKFLTSLCNMSFQERKASILQDILCKQDSLQ